MIEQNAFYRDWLHVRRPDIEFVSSAAEIPLDSTTARFGREKASHKGIGERQALRELEACAANQPMLEEICTLTGLEYLDLGWPMVAKDLAPLEALQNLRTLKIDSPRHIADFTPITRLPALERLLIANSRHMASLDWLSPLRDRLKVLGIEGSIWTVQPIPTLAPLRGFALEALFLTSTSLADQDLSPIATMPNLRVLGTGIIAPRAQFMALRDACPDLVCDWLDEASWGDLKDPRPPQRA